MGGYGSTRWSWHDPKPLVEHCFKLTIRDLKRFNMLEPNQSGVLTRGKARLAYRTSTQGGGSRKIHFIYTMTPFNGEPIHLDYPVTLILQPMPRGEGFRYEFYCPLVGCKTNGVRAIYLPPRQKYFGCRKCHGLAYESSRESRKPPALVQALMDQSGLKPKAFINSPWMDRLLDYF